MEKYIDILLDSMVKHDAALLPMADRYSATENGIAAAVSHMTCWRTVQKINCVTHKVLDPVLGQAVVVAQVDEGGYPTLMAARIKVEEDKISELELFLLRSRAESGFWYAPKDLAKLPDGWYSKIPEGGRASREELIALGMDNTTGKQKYFYCRTPRQNAAYICAGRTPENDILEAVLEGLHVQALMAVELCRLWEEQHREQAKDTAAKRKTLAGLREAHGQLCQQIKGLYESFALGEISKPEYLAAKAAAIKQRDTSAARIADLEAALENMGANGGLRNDFVSTFGKYTEVEEITSEIATEVLKEVRIYPGGRIEIVWNLQDELEKLTLALQGDCQKTAPAK